MAQSKREQINIVGKEASIPRDEKNTVPDLLLDYHRIHLTRRVANRISSRALFLLIAGCLVFANHVSLFHLLASLSATFLLAFIWHSERRLLVTRLKALEEILAERSDEGWEDIYIQFRYRNLQPTGFYKSSYEPFIWALFVCLVGLLRLFFEKKLGL